MLSHYFSCKRLHGYLINEISLLYFIQSGHISATKRLLKGASPRVSGHHKTVRGPNEGMMGTITFSCYVSHQK